MSIKTHFFIKANASVKTFKNRLHLDIIVFSPEFLSEFDNTNSNIKVLFLTFKKEYLVAKFNGTLKIELSVTQIRVLCCNKSVKHLYDDC